MPLKLKLSGYTYTGLHNFYWSSSEKLYSDKKLLQPPISSSPIRVKAPHASAIIHFDFRAIVKRLSHNF